MAEALIRVLSGAEGVARAAARRVVAAAAEATAARGRFVFVLAGGSTPARLYRRLAGRTYRDRIDWSRTVILFGDERCVPPTHPDSNYRMAEQALLSRVPLRPENILRMRGELDPDEAARDYEERLHVLFDGGPPRADLVLLGIGDDGHTASLFPGTRALDERVRSVVANEVPAAGTTRLTWTLPALAAARRILFLVVGPAKAEALRSIHVDGSSVPAGRVAPGAGTVEWLVDREAAAGLRATRAPRRTGRRDRR